MFVFLLTDIFFYIIIFSLGYYVYYVRKTKDILETWKHVFKSKTGIISIVVLAFFLLIAILDSIHFKEKIKNEKNDLISYSSEIKSVLDLILLPTYQNTEKSYSSPFSSNLYSKETRILENNIEQRVYPKLLYKGNHNKYSEKNSYNIFLTFIFSLLKYILIFSTFYFFLFYKTVFKGVSNLFHHLISNKTFFATISVILLISIFLYDLSLQYYVLGTDKVGVDVLYKSIKSIRTGILIGTLTTIVMLPFAIFLGIFAGYIGGLVDDVIQYVYTTLNSIPSVLLIASAILMLQVYMANNPMNFENIYERALS